MSGLRAPFPADADSVAFIIAEEPAISWRAPKHRSSGDRQSERYRNLHAVECPTPPGIEPGQLWIVEHSLTDRHLPPLGCQAIAAANVVIYDRALYSIVAENLPLAGYAEPGSSPDGLPDTTFDRCIHFAGDGWSVVWFVDHRPPDDARSKRVGRLVDRLIGAGSPVSQSVTLFVDAPGSVLRQTETKLERLGMVIDAMTSEDCLALAFAAVGTGTAPHLHAISSNGLAG